MKIGWYWYFVLGQAEFSYKRIYFMVKICTDDYSIQNYLRQSMANYFLSHNIQIKARLSEKLQKKHTFCAFYFF